MAPRQAGRAASTWLVNYHEIIEQCLMDLCDWVEQGVAPAATQFTFQDGKVTLPDSAAERGGIQPVVKVRANGEIKAHAKVRESVVLRVEGEVPPGAGAVILVEWDFDGSGTYPERHRITAREARIDMTTTHVYEEAGVYFATARVTSHRGGDPDAEYGRCENLASARVIVS
jgi:hypothetical protein